eukprot:9231481-Pyramimonas_sp.AAC.1
MFLEQNSDVLKQDSLNQQRSKNIPCRPQKVIRTCFGRPIGKPGRLVAARAPLRAPHDLGAQGTA